MIKCCIFDLDGTLLNTLSTITYYVNKTLEQEGLSPITEEECKYFVGDGPELLIRRALASKGYLNDGGVLRILKKYKENYSASPLWLTEPYEGVMDMLRDLSEKGIACAIISNKQHEAVIPVVRSFFKDLITLARGAMAGVPLKPKPDAVYMMLNELGVLPEEVVYVGDTGVDMQTGRAFSAAKTIGVTWGFRDQQELVKSGADVVVSSTAELLSEVAKC